MSFHRREQEAIYDDQRDNDTIREIVDRHNRIKRQLDQTKAQLQQANLRNDSLIQENEELKEEQERLKDQLIAQTKDRAQDWAAKTMPEASTLKVQVETLASAQQTKRRSINGFVNDLTLELDQQEDAFKRERRMLAEARRELQLRNEEVTMLRATVRQLETQLSVVNRHNVHLATRVTPPNNTFLLSSQSFDSEMGRMDELFRAMEIEVDLALS